MSVSKDLLLLSILLWVRCVSADGGDDFANNLFSDLGPLLALFGERVTMQFMSGAMGWADNVILAMAPLGIITAIVGAIRVGGPSWLKAVIGRARENLAVAEAELMSSTSQEVCELWNGQEVVRCTGSPSLVEFICLLPEKEQTIGGALEVEVDDQEFKDQDDHLESMSLNVKDDFQRWRAPNKHPGVKDPENYSMQQLPERVIIKRNSSLDAPNISLNTHRQSRRAELRIVAAFGTILQLGVLLYSGFATYHHALKFQKDDNPIASYAYPCASTGTLILVVGMMLCAHVVESSTTEKRFQPKRSNMRVRMVWLQQTKTVGDQVFGSFAIYSKEDQDFITTSRRSQKDESEQSHSTTGEGEYATSNGVGKSQRSRSTAEGSMTLQLKTVLGTTTTLTGFVLQFVGLRGLHWSASIAQLGAVFLMVCLKAWVRRGLATPPYAKPLPPGYELDWFAKTLGKIDEAPWNHDAKSVTRLGQTFDAGSDTEPSMQSAPESSEKSFNGEWRIASSGSVYLGCKSTEERSRDEAEATAPIDPNILTPINKVVFNAQRVLDVRKKLGHLARWRGPASAEAVSLARAIEITMNALIGSSSIDSGSSDTFYWSLDASYDGLNQHPINFHLKRHDGKWKAHANEYEAALSLWLSSVDDESKRVVNMSEQENKRAVEPPEPRKGTEGLMDKEDDARLRMEESKSRQGLRLLGSHTPTLRRNLQWWVPKELLHIFEIRPNEAGGNDGEDGGRLQMETHRVIGYVPRQWADGNKQPAGSIQFTRKTLVNETTNEDGNKFTEDPGETTVLAAESYYSLPQLFAQHMFSAFMCALTSTNKHVDFFKTVADVKLHTAGVGTWKSFTLQNTTLSTMVREIESTGLGSLEDVYLSVITPLSENKRLPRADDAIIELARQQDQQHEQLQHWEEAADVYLWLFRMANTFKDPHIVAKATAVLMEYLRYISSVIDSRKGKDESEVRNLNWAKRGVEEKLKNSANYCIIVSLMRFYKGQGREWEFPEVFVQEAQASSEENNTYSEMFNFEDLRRKVDGTFAHSLELRARHLVRIGGSQQKRAGAKDIHYWAPLHYAARWAHHHEVQSLLTIGGVFANSRDLMERTPLHYACQLGKNEEELEKQRESTIYTLISEGADVNAQGKDGMTPLHCASIEGNERAVIVLIEAGASVDVLDISGTTPLLWAAYKGWTNIVKNLWGVANGRLRDNSGRTALHLAAISGQTDLAGWLITAREADKEARDRYRRRPLHWAAMNGHHEIALLLAEEAPKRDDKDTDSMTPLHYAAANGYEKVVRLLLKQGVEMDAKADRSETPLHLAAGNGHEEVATLLVEYGADMDVRDQNGNTALHQAARYGHEEVVKLLVEHGANKEERNWDDETPLQAAIQGRSEGAVQVLIDHRVDLEAPSDSHDKMGPLTPLQHAAWSGYTSIVKKLLGGQANRDVLGDDGLSLLGFAVEGGHTEVVRLLIETLGFDAKAVHPHYNGESLLHTAVWVGNADLVDLLIAHGANTQLVDHEGKTAQQRALDNLRAVEIEGDGGYGLESRGGRSFVHSLKETSRIVVLLSPEEK